MLNTSDGWYDCLLWLRLVRFTKATGHKGHVIHANRTSSPEALTHTRLDLGTDSDIPAYAGYAELTRH